MKVLVYDIETLKEIFYIDVYNPETGIHHSFEISEGINQIDSFVHFMEEHKDFFWVGFNCIRFDAQIIEWMLRNYQKWYDLSSLEICAKIALRAQDVIDDSNYEIAPEYREDQLSFKQIDLFTIWHFNNENRRTSLKSVEFAICFDNIEEIPIDPNKTGLTEEEKQMIRMYCQNDVMATYELYKITRGDTDIKIFKGEDKLLDRITMSEEFGLNCLNWDDVKIGAEWNKADYIKLTGKREYDLRPQKVNYFFGKKFKTFFPKTVSFQTPELKRFVNNLGNTYALNKPQEFKFDFAQLEKYIKNKEVNLIATIAKGGIHSNEKGRFIQPKEDEIYYQCDIGSQYPNAIRKYRVEPSHLPGWNKTIVAKIERRLHYKTLYNQTKDPKYNSLQKMGKLALNGGSYGRLNTKGDWQQDPCCMLQVTMGGQLELLMIAEHLILKGFRIVSLNTDGFDAVIPKARDKEFKDILTHFEKVIGNDVLGQFEYTEFLWIAQTSVNDYIALKKDGTLKVKGDFEIDKELHKNTSMRIVPIALKEYFVNNIPVRDTIMKHTNIYDFCIKRKSSKDFHYEGRKGAQTTTYKKLIRYYVSLSGEKLYKIKNPECITNAPAVAQVEAGKWLCTVRNYLPHTTKVEDCGIDYDYYIDRVERIIIKIDKQYKKEKFKDKQQLSFNF